MSARWPVIRLLLGAALVCAVPVTAAVAQGAQQAPALSNTAAGRQLAAWLERFNGDDPEAFEAHMRREFPGWPAPPGSSRDLRNLTGGFELVRVESASDSRIVALIKERDWDIFARVTFEVDSNGKITSAPILSIPAPPDAPAIVRASEHEALAALKAKLDEASASGAFSGAVRVSLHGRTVFEYVGGLADRERGQPNTLKTRFRIGSMNKMFTAVSILQLVEAGQIDLDAPIGTYLPDYPNQDLALRVTIRHLLTHTGGTGDIFTPEYDARRLELCEHSDYLALFGSRNAAFAPGERFAYSNYGYVLLGAIVEAVSGQSYYDYVEQHIYAPANMTASGSLPETVEVPGRSTGYTNRLPGSNGQWLPNSDTLPCRGTAAGGGYSTVGDLIRFSEALRSGRLLGSQMLQSTTTRQVAMGPGGGERDGYGFGFGVIEVNGARTFGHNGGAPGMAAALLVLPELGYDIAVAANIDTPLIDRLVEYVGARLPAATPAVAKSAQERAAETDTASAPTTPPQAADAGTSEIVVTARAEQPPTPREAYEQAVELSRIGKYQLHDEALPRFWGPVCPGVAGLKVASAERMVERIRDNAERAGIPLAEPGCLPNLIVAFADSGKSWLADLQRRQPAIFERVAEEELAELLSDPYPARVFTDMVWQWTGRGSPPGGWPKVRASHGGAWSRVAMPEVQAIVSALVVFDRAAARERTLMQLADYATMRGLARTRPAVGDEALPTILALFARAAPAPPELTSFDVGYLRSLYEAQPNRPAANRLLLAHRRAREEQARGAFADEAPAGAP